MCFICFTQYFYDFKNVILKIVFIETTILKGL